MSEARSVIERLDRIETMRRANAGTVELLGELRCLAREAEDWVEIEGDHAAAAAVGNLRQALRGTERARVSASPLTDPRSAQASTPAEIEAVDSGGDLSLG